MKKDAFRRFIIDKPIFFSVFIFLLCFTIRLFEYFVIKTDTTFFSENFIHKLFGITVLFMLLGIVHYKPSNIGFKKRNWLKYLISGLLFGGICFAVAYLLEYIVLCMEAQDPSFELYVNGFSLIGNEIKHTELFFFILCIMLNVINVVMEEGLFRGFFYKILRHRNNFWKSILIVTLLFGLWHFVMPFQLLINEEINLMYFAVMTLGYIVLSGIMSLKWSLLYEMTGSLFIGIGDHLFNNVIATNLLHLVTNSGADKLQIIRIFIAQSISFIIVLLLYYNKNKIYESWHCHALIRKK